MTPSNLHLLTDAPRLKARRLGKSNILNFFLVFMKFQIGSDAYIDLEQMELLRNILNGYLYFGRRINRSYLQREDHPSVKS